MLLRICDELPGTDAFRDALVLLGCRGRLAFRRDPAYEYLPGRLCLRQLRVDRVRLYHSSICLYDIRWNDLEA